MAPFFVSSLAGALADRAPMIRSDEERERLATARLLFGKEFAEGMRRSIDRERAEGLARWQAFEEARKGTERRKERRKEARERRRKT